MTELQPILLGPIDVRPVNICILGPPGAGKTTFTRMLSRELRANLVVTSEFLNSLVEENPDSEQAKYIQMCFGNGTNVDNQTIHHRLLAKVENEDFLVTMIDGFPRTASALRDYLQWVNQGNRQTIVVHLFAKLETCRNRFLAKSPSRSTNEIFEKRIYHYSQVERKVIAGLKMFPILNIDSSDR